MDRPDAFYLEAFDLAEKVFQGGSVIADRAEFLGDAMICVGWVAQEAAQQAKVRDVLETKTAHAAVNLPDGVIRGLVAIDNEARSLDRLFSSDFVFDLFRRLVVNKLREPEVMSQLVAWLVPYLQDE